MNNLVITTPQVWDKEAVTRLLATSNKAVARAVVTIYRNQTEYEKVCQSTQESNGIGFTGVDAEILSSYAEFYLKNGFLTTKQLAIARNKIKKYWRQLLVEIERRGQAVSFKTTRTKSNGVPK